MNRNPPTSKTLPTGTVTFLFTDIVGSTPLWERQPELMAQALEIHHTALRNAIETRGGVVFKTIGDAFQAAFPTAPLALQAAIEGQIALQSAPWNELGELKVRMGLHTGEAEFDPGGDEYAVSHTKNRAARIMSAASGGQILLSQETADLVLRKLPGNVTLKDLGEHRLKGMEWLEHLYQVNASGLPQGFPALETSVTHPNNLPIQVTSFIGREKEIEAVHRLLASHRLVTLTGSGGTGKSRLSLQIAAQCLEGFPNGVWLVELAPLADPDLIPKTVASALQLPEIPGKTFREALVDFLRPKRLLLVLDNCEHLLEACADLADQLFHTCPDLTILASSREFLGVEGEVPYRVPPMSLPDARHLPSLEALSGYDAVNLFVERARLVTADFTLSDENAGVIAQVVNRLDGIPLAIELAASRLRVLGINQIAQRLDDTFRLLTGGSRSKLPRHQTLRACIDWSYNLLSEPERVLLRRLSVFAGSWRLRAAEQVCAQALGGLQLLYPEDILDLLSELVDKSLISTVSSADGRNRFRMLETVRQYMSEKLANEKSGDEGESQALRTQHLAYYLELVEMLSPKIRGPEQIETLDQLEMELDNLRLALEWALHTDVETELRLAASLQWFWHIRSLWSEGVEWLERGLELARRDAPGLMGDQAKSILYARILNALSFHHLKQMSQGFEINRVQLKENLEESMRIFRSANLEPNPGNRRDLAWAVIWLSQIYRSRGDYAQALGLSQEAHSLFREVGDLTGIDESLKELGYMEIIPILRKQFHQEQLAVAQASGDTERIAEANHFIGMAHFGNGDYQEAFVALELSMQLLRQVNNPISTAAVSVPFGWSALYRGDFAQASRIFDQAITTYRNLGFENRAALILAMKCLPALAEGRVGDAGGMIEEALNISRKPDDLEGVTNVLYIRARLARLNEDESMARDLAEELVNRKRLPAYGKVWGLVELGHLALRQGNLPQAQAYLREGFQTYMRSRGIIISVAHVFDSLGWLAARQQRAELASRLIGSRWCRGHANILSPIEKDWRKQDFSAIKKDLGQKGFEQLYKEGFSLSFEQVVSLVSEMLDR